MDNTHYHFISTLRRGLAAGIREAAPDERARIEVELHAARRRMATGTWDDKLPPIPRTLQLRGPGDLVDFDESIVVRTDPKPDTGNFEPHYFPAVEFSDPDFPWRYTADVGGPNGLTPWIALVVLVAENRGDVACEFTDLPRADHQRKTICVHAQTSLPDPKLAHLWAHVHVTTGTDELSDEQLRDLLHTNPECVVGRLMNTRPLQPGTLYTAFVVPTFKLGWAAGIDTEQARAQAAGSSALDYAWDHNSPEPIELPVYYSWSFRTSARGDFEYLVRLLEARELPGLGLRRIDCEHTGFGLGVTRSNASDEDAHVLEMEGALQSIDTTYTAWGKDTGPLAPAHSPPAEPFQEELADLLARAEPDQIVADLPAGFGAGILDELSFQAMPDGTSVRVSWSTATESTARIDWGPETAGQYQYLNTAASEQPATEHTLVLTLAPETRYHFRVTVVDAAAYSRKTTPDAVLTLRLPAVVPPIYGRWHAGRSAVSADTSHNGWLDVLNLDPRHRAAGGLGPEVIRRNREALMASAWGQVGAIEAANDILRRAQMGRGASIVLHDRLDSAELEDYLKLTAPVQKRLSLPYPRQWTAVPAFIETRTLIPPATLSPAFRRIVRPRGPIRKRQGARFALHAIERLTSGEFRAAGEPLAPEGTPTPCEISARTYQHFVAEQIAGDQENGVDPLDDLGNGVGVGNGVGLSSSTPIVLSDDLSDRLFYSLLAPTVVSVTPTPGETADTMTVSLPVPGTNVMAYVQIQTVNDPIEFMWWDILVPARAKRFCDGHISCAQLPEMDGAIGLEPGDVTAQAVCDALATLLTPAHTVPTRQPMNRAFLESLRRFVHDALDPRTTIKERTKRRLRLQGALAGSLENRSGDALDPLMTYPEFPQPMYEPLKDISHSLILPGEKIPFNTIGLLETNRRFVESYMVGLNHEFAGELLWRRFPTDQRGSYFRQFWDVREYVGDPALGEVDDDELTPAIHEKLRDIRPLHEWGDAPLGSNHAQASSSGCENLVLVIRGDLFKRYPNTVVYSVEAIHDASTKEPVPDLPEFVARSVPRPIYPVFRGSLGDDLVFFGFPFSECEARSSEDSAGKYFVLEERVSEARFGLDEPPDKTWDEHTSSALLAKNTLQRPARLAMHADRMLP